MNYLAKVAHQLWKHANNGDILVVPGGQNADNQGITASFGLATAYNTDIQEVEYWLVPKLISAFARGELMLKDPEIHFLEEPKGTMVREVLEETGLKPLECIDLDNYQQNPHYEKAAGVHIQSAYWITRFDDRNVHKYPPMDGRTGVPLWVPESLVRNCLWKRHHWILDEVQARVARNEIQLMTRNQKKREPVAA